MKMMEIALFGVAAYVIYAVMKSNSLASANTVQNVGPAINGVSQIFTNAAPGTPGAGWKYYTDGTSIDAAGNYYMNGVLVWPHA